MFNTLRPRQNGHHFTDDIFKWIFLNENVWISINISLFVPRGPINNIPTLVQVMAWRRPGDKPLVYSNILIWTTLMTYPVGIQYEIYVLSVSEFPIVKRRRSYDRLISTMGFPILLRHLYTESGRRRTCIVTKQIKLYSVRLQGDDVDTICDDMNKMYTCTNLILQHW